MQSLSISSGSTVASRPGSGLCAALRPKLPCRSRGCCLRLSASSSCITPPTYCAALGETEFMPLSPQSGALLLLIATQNCDDTASKKQQNETQSGFTRSHTRSHAGNYTLRQTELDIG
ncbi:hypothetical protein EYF80_006124 [Liparis tanakae]|uniref:Uncharacterized protein n=1 Tax=Liparis tanakae TaxID=230148 RepID=A0A4Z2J0A7_9TELE|nr:hypothetical protein EYF80_006124 [Liparis tanakae]